MLSAEAQPSGEGSAGFKSGVTEGSMGIDGGSASMSAADAGSASKEDGLKLSRLRAIKARGTGRDDGGGSGGEAQRVNDDLRDVEAED